jgi:chaperonin GroEL (HSP60 family)
VTERPARKLRAGSAIGIELVVAGGGAAVFHVMRAAREKKRKECNAQDAIGYIANQRSTGREWEMLRKLAGEQRKKIARKVAKARWDEKRREEPREAA